jgi:hypothetical protein
MVASAVATGAVVNIDLPARPIPKVILWKAVSGPRGIGMAYSDNWNEAIGGKSSFW